MPEDNLIVFVIIIFLNPARGIAYRAKNGKLLLFKPMQHIANRLGPEFWAC